MKFIHSTSFFGTGESTKIRLVLPSYFVCFMRCASRGGPHHAQDLLCKISGVCLLILILKISISHTRFSAFCSCGFSDDRIIKRLVGRVTRSFSVQYQDRNNTSEINMCIVCLLIIKLVSRRKYILNILCE